MPSIEGLYLKYLQALGAIVLHRDMPEKRRPAFQRQFKDAKEKMGVITAIVTDSKSIDFPTAVLQYAAASADLLEREDLPTDIWPMIADAENDIETLLAPEDNSISIRLRALARAYHAVATGAWA
jgi:hypothetical protein